MTRRGLTLLEVLLGVLLLALVGALAFSLVLGARRAVDRQSDRAARLQPASDALEALRLDLACALAPETGEPPFFKLTETVSGSELTLVTAVPPVEPESPLSRHRVLRVNWRVEPDGAGRPALVRTARPERAAGETPPGRFQLEGVRALTIQVYGAAARTWAPTWLTGPGGPLPAAARVAVTVETSRGVETVSRETVIPAGVAIGP